jgi:hypothetical protein
VTIRLLWSHRNGGGNTFFGGNNMFLWFSASIPVVFKSFMPFTTFFLQKQTSQTNPSSLTNIGKG